MNENQNITRGFRPKRLSWLTIVLALLAIITFAMISRPNYQYIMPMGIVGGIMEEFGSSESVPPMTGMTRDVDYGVSYKEMPDSRDI